MEVCESRLERAEEGRSARPGVQIILACNIRYIDLAQVAKLKRPQRDLASGVRFPVGIVGEIKSRLTCSRQFYLLPEVKKIFLRRRIAKKHHGIVSPTALFIQLPPIAKLAGEHLLIVG